MQIVLRIIDAGTGALLATNKTFDTTPGGSQVIEFLDDGAPFRDPLVVIAATARPGEAPANSLQVLLGDLVVLLDESTPDLIAPVPLLLP
jgi:hypothetical protein